MDNKDKDQTAPEAPADGDAAEPSALERLEQKLAEAEQKAAENWEKCLRATAELENVRRRVERDSAIQRKYAIEGILTDLLSVIDSLELALKAVDGESPEVRAHLEGVQLTHKQFWSVLERHGMGVVDPLGEAFNPDLHQAVSMQETGEVPANRIVSVMQKGYRLHDRLLRPAMVVVARPPAAETPGGAGEGANSP